MRAPNDTRPYLQAPQARRYMQEASSEYLQSLMQHILRIAPMPRQVQNLIRAQMGIFSQILDRFYIARSKAMPQTNAVLSNLQRKLHLEV